MIQKKVGHCYLFGSHLSTEEIVLVQFGLRAGEIHAQPARTCKMDGYMVGSDERLPFGGSKALLLSGGFKLLVLGAGLSRLSITPSSCGEHSKHPGSFTKNSWNGLIDLVVDGDFAFCFLLGFSLFRIASLKLRNIP